MVITMTSESNYHEKYFLVEDVILIIFTVSKTTNSELREDISELLDL